MPDCSLLTTCIFFNDKMLNMPASAALMKQTYCQDDFGTCARFMVFKTLGRPKVPKDLFPTEVARAREIIAKG